MASTWLVLLSVIIHSVLGDPLFQLKQALDNNDWIAIESLIKSKTLSDETLQTKYLDEFTIASHKVQTKTRRVESIALTRAKGANIAHPALQWAQNESVVFIEAKYATRWGAPACTSAQVKQVEILPKKMKLISQTETGGQVFELDLTLFGDIDVENSAWSASSVGRVSFSLKKSQVGQHWDQLTENTPPWNCKFWFELQDTLGYGAGWMHSSDGTNVVNSIGKKESTSETTSSHDRLSNIDFKMNEQLKKLKIRQETMEKELLIEKNKQLDELNDISSRDVERVNVAHKAMDVKVRHVLNHSSIMSKLFALKWKPLIWFLNYMLKYDIFLNTMSTIEDYVGAE